MSKRYLSLTFALVVMILVASYSAIFAPSPVITLANSSTPTSSTGYSFQRRLFTAAGREWFFTVENYNDGFRTCLLTNPCGSDPTQWSTQTQLGGQSAADGLSIWYDSTSNTVSYIRTIGTGFFFYRYGMPNGDGTVTWAAAEVYKFSSGSGDSFPSIFNSGTNNIWVAVSTTQGLEVWQFNGASWNNKITVASRGGTLAGIIISLTGTQYALITGDVTGSGDNLVIRTTGDGVIWNPPVTATSLFSLNEANAVSIGNTLYLAGSVPGFIERFLSCAYPCASVPTEQTIAPLSDNRWATISTDGAQTLVVVYEVNPNTAAYVGSTNLGVVWGSPVTISSAESFAGASWSGTVTALMVGGTALFGWTSSSGQVRFGSVAPSGAVVTVTATALTTTSITITSQLGVSYTTSTTTVTVTSTSVSS